MIGFYKRRISIKQLNKGKKMTNNNNWLTKLWQWADENNIQDFSWLPSDSENGGIWIGLSRDEDTLLQAKEIALIMSKIKYLPVELFNLTNIEKLYLTWNDIETIPNEIENLVNLKELYLAHNNLEHLPEVLNKLPKLEKIVIEGNPIEIDTTVSK